MIHFK